MAQDAPYPPQGNEPAPRDPRRNRAGEYEPVELSETLPPMELWQDKTGLWMYARPAWVGGPAIEPNGVPPGVVDQDNAMRVVNILYPHAFPEAEPQMEDLGVDRPVIDGPRTAYRE